MNTDDSRRAGDVLETDYRAALEWLFRQTRGTAARDPLRMEAIAGYLGLTMPSTTVHVVGTNGKGTVTAMVAASMSAAGKRSGTFTSPHVEEFRERILVGGRPISRRAVVEFVDLVRSREPRPAPAFFELCLALALHCFEREGVEFAAFEAGVGARYDATAILRNVAVTAITPISRDHLGTLGSTVAEIAVDKSAAIRFRTPVVSAMQSSEVAAVIESVAGRLEAPLYLESGDDGLFRLPEGLPDPNDAIRAQNRRVAAAVVRLTGGVSEQALSRGLSIPPLPGRGERFTLGGIEVLLDGAHDPAAANALTLRAGREYVLLFGSLQRKLGEETLTCLERRATSVWVTSAGGEPTSVAASPGRRFIAEPDRALVAALASCAPGGLLVISGSLYLAGEMRPRLRGMGALPVGWSSGEGSPNEEKR